jgi:hypothetical protein
MMNRFEDDRFRGDTEPEEEDPALIAQDMLRETNDQGLAYIQEKNKIGEGESVDAAMRVLKFKVRNFHSLDEKEVVSFDQVKAYALGVVEAFIPIAFTKNSQSLKENEERIEKIAEPVIAEIKNAADYSELASAVEKMPEDDGDPEHYGSNAEVWGSRERIELDSLKKVLKKASLSYEKGLEIKGQNMN